MALSYWLLSGKNHMSKLKVIRVVTTPECVPWHLGNTLVRMKDDFDVTVVGQNVSSYAERYPDIKWVNIDINRRLNPFSDLISILQLCRIFIKYKPDIVHSIMPKAGLLAAVASLICFVPVRIHSFTGQVWATKHGIPRFFYKVIDRLIIFINTLCLTDSPSQSSYLYHHNISYRGVPLQVLSKGSLSGVEVSRFNNETIKNEAKKLRKKVGITESDFVFAFIARKSHDKGAYEIIRAFSSLSQLHSNIKLLFVGPDESDGDISILIKSNSSADNHIIDIDKVDNHEVYLALSDVLCLPSYREGFGSIVIDAAALSIPTIGSDIPGLVDSIENGSTGVLIPVGDTRKLVDAMSFFIVNPEKAKEMGNRAYERVENFFTADILYDALRDTYRRLVSK